MAALRGRERLDDMRFRHCPFVVAAAFLLTASPAAARSLDPAALEELLNSLDYGVETLDREAFQVSVGSGDAGCKLRVALSDSGELLWAFAYMAALASIDQISKDALVRLLTANETYGPAYFSIGSDNGEPKWLYLNRAVENKDLSGGDVRAMLEGLCSTAHDAIGSLAGASTD